MIRLIFIDRLTIVILPLNFMVKQRTTTAESLRGMSSVNFPTVSTFRIHKENEVVKAKKVLIKELRLLIPGGGCS